MSQPIRLAYTFGNHMHWVDMEWLWGYDVLPGSVDDMLAYCSSAGIRGCVNFDGIGLEKLAAEDPESLARLRAAVQAGVIEVVGASYGQPYGLLHGGESNIRQRVYGVRVAMRLLGVRPRTFWEEEFDLFPQLPQILAGCGFTGASLYFQWTWHTPEVPKEELPVVAWEGADGTRLPAATRNRLNLHQWPEDFRILLDELAASPPEQTEGAPPPLILQWLELMPSQDWMCRSELMAPMLKELVADPRFEVEPVTLGAYLEQWQGLSLEPRHLTEDDVWHGMTLGKHGDRHIQVSRELEEQLRLEESAAAILGLFGRPYEPWDVYPTWELEECWRLLLAAQHHDNHECQGLCGHVAEAQFAMARELLRRSSSIDRLARRLGTDEIEWRSGSWIGWQPCPPVKYASGWSRRNGGFEARAGSVNIRIEVGPKLTVAIQAPERSVEGLQVFGTFGQAGRGRIWTMTQEPSFDDDLLHLHFDCCSLLIAVTEEGLMVTTSWNAQVGDGWIDPGYGGALQLHFEPDGGVQEVIRDTPYAVLPVGQGSSGRRKYPKDDWMTSEQWFEDVSGAFTSHSWVHLGGAAGISIRHDSASGWFRDPSWVAAVCLALDPWDGSHQGVESSVTFLISASPAAPALGGSAAVQHPRPSSMRRQPGSQLGSAPALPPDFRAVASLSPTVAPTAFFREQESFAKKGLDSYAGEGMGHPYIMRLVEWSGEPLEAELIIAGPISKAVLANMMGEPIRELAVESADPTLLTSRPKMLEPFGIEACRIRLPMRGREIATLYLDIVPGRKQVRDLDAKREVWATVHRPQA